MIVSFTFFVLISKRPIRNLYTGVKYNAILMLLLLYNEITSTENIFNYIATKDIEGFMNTTSSDLEI